MVRTPERRGQGWALAIAFLVLVPSAALALPPAPGPGAAALHASGLLPLEPAGDPPGADGPCGPSPVGCTNIPFVVDESGDTMVGNLTMRAPLVMTPGQPVRFPGGDLTAPAYLTFGERLVCVAHLHHPGCGRIAAVDGGPGIAAVEAAGVVGLRIGEGEGIAVGANGIAVRFAGSGTAPAAARADHTHAHVRTIAGVAPDAQGNVAIRTDQHLRLEATPQGLALGFDGVAEALDCTACIGPAHLRFAPVTQVVAGPGLQAKPGPVPGQVVLDIPAGAIGLSQLAFKPLTGFQVQGRGLISAIADGVPSLGLSNGGIEAEHLAPASVGLDKLSFQPVTAVSPEPTLHAALDGTTLTLGVPPGAITGTEVATRTIGTNHLADGAVQSGQLADQAVTRSKLAPGAVDGAAIADGAITTEDLAAELGFAGGAATLFDYGGAGPLESGNVVAIDPQNPDLVRKALAGAAAGLVIGVVQDDAALRHGTGSVPVATTGKVQVYVRARATNDSIEVGELLVPSGLAGVAMDCPPNANGCRGSVVAKALERYTNTAQPGLVWAIVSLS